MKEMELYVKKKQEAETAESHYVECSTKGVWLSVGSVVKLSCSFGKRIGSVANASMGEFLVIDVTHEVGDDRFYGNSFRAIPSVARSLPVRDVGRSVAETQVARVIGNADPDGKGRVQVQMNWQTGNMRTGWIRVMTPDGGGSENVSTNRGFVFIPEVGDHVLVGFRHGDPNRPYVMGSLFNGRTGKGGGEDNFTKSLTTRSGSTITFDEAAHTIVLRTTHANSIFVDERNGTLAISSAEEVSVKTKDVNIEASGNMKLNVDKDLDILVGGNTNLAVGGNTSLTIGGNAETQIGGYQQTTVEGKAMYTSSDIALMSTNGDTIISAASKALLQGGDDARVSKK